jgi:hypothetical protein
MFDMKNTLYIKHFTIYYVSYVSFSNSLEALLIVCYETRLKKFVERRKRVNFRMFRVVNFSSST